MKLNQVKKKFIQIDIVEDDDDYVTIFDELPNNWTLLLHCNTIEVEIFFYLPN